MRIQGQNFSSFITIALLPVSTSRKSLQNSYTICHLNSELTVCVALVTQFMKKVEQYLNLKTTGKILSNTEMIHSRSLR